MRVCVCVCVCVTALPGKELIAEKIVPLSVASSTQKLLAGVLGLMNLGGVLWLGNVLQNPLLFIKEPILIGALSKVGGDMRRRFDVEILLIYLSL